MSIQMYCKCIVIVLLCFSMNVFVFAETQGNFDPNSGLYKNQSPTEKYSALDDKSLLIEANNNFAFDLYKDLSTDSKYEGQNLFFSPFSIFSALALTNEGARNITKDEITSVLHLSKDDSARRNGFLSMMKEISGGKTSYVLKNANALWADNNYSFLPDYMSIAEQYYGAEVHNLDIRNSPDNAASKINKWVEEKTDDYIKNLIKPGALSSFTRLVITNAIYFNGNWENSFDKNLTYDKEFRINPENKTPVRMMQINDNSFRYYEDENLQVIELPYAKGEGKELSMLILLPKSVNITPAEDALNVKKLSEIRKNLTKNEVDVNLPKFNFTEEYKLKPILTSLGMSDAFSENADFSGMDGKHNLYISDVLHKSFVDVDEKGTKAAAATAVIFNELVMLKKEYKFIADHPFIFLIQDTNDGTIYFIGRVMNPAIS